MSANQQWKAEYGTVKTEECWACSYAGRSFGPFLLRTYWKRARWTHSHFTPYTIPFLFLFFSLVDLFFFTKLFITFCFHSFDMKAIKSAYVRRFEHYRLRRAFFISPIPFHILLVYGTQRRWNVVDLLARNTFLQVFWSFQIFIHFLPDFFIQFTRGAKVLLYERLHKYWIQFSWHSLGF